MNLVLLCQQSNYSFQAVNMRKRATQIQTQDKVCIFQLRLEFYDESDIDFIKSLLWCNVAYNLLKVQILLMLAAARDGNCHVFENK